jgi:hypothetical protein
MKTDKIPAGLTLGNRPRKIKARCDLQRGETLSFEYFGGEDAGKRRTVLVLETDETYFKGVCLERGGEFRQYLWDNAVNPQTVPPFVKQVVTYEVLPLDQYMQALMASR